MNEITTQSNKAPATAGFLDIQGFELIQRVGKAFASSDLIPKQYQDNLSNCMIALDMANRMNANPLMVMQNLYVVHGNPSFSSKFLIASVNVCGRFSSLRYEWKGEPDADDFGCRAWAVERETGERLDGIWVTWKMVKAEGWSSKSGSKWKTMPDQMFVYRAAAFWQRAYAPEVSMGLMSAEEAHDIVDVLPDGTVADVYKSNFVDMPKSKSAKKAKSEPAEIVPTAETATPVAEATAKTAANTDGEVLATDGEKTFIKAKLENVNMPISQAIEICSVQNTIDTLTKSDAEKLLEFAKELAEG